jgi:hypothetical protein
MRLAVPSECDVSKPASMGLEDVRDQAVVRAADSCGLTGLGQIRARETGGQEAPTVLA